MDLNDVVAMMGTQFWQVTALGIVVLGANRLLSRKRPHLSHLLWLVVLLKCVTPPIVATPWSVLGWADQGLHANARHTESQFAPGDPTQTAIRPSDGMWPTDESIAMPLMETIPSQRANPGGTLLVKNEINATFVLLSVWAIGTVLVFMTFFVRCIRQMNVVIRDRSENQQAIDQMVADLARRIGLRGRVEVVLTRSNVGPAVVGLFRPKIILPSAIVDGRDVSELEPILAHELVHIRRGDLWLGAAQWVIQAVWWFHPLVWLGNRMMNRDAERCCDEEVIAELRYSPARYARMLLDVLSRKQEITPMSSFPGVRPVDVTSQRLERIMRLGQGSLRRTPRLYVVFAIALAVVALPGSRTPIKAQEKVIQDAWEATTADDRSSWASVSQDQTDRGPSSPQITKLYSISELQPRIDDAGINVEAVIFLLRTIDHSIESRRGEDPQYMPSPLNDSIAVRHTAAGHQRVAEMLKAMTRFGFGQIAIEVRVMTMPSELAKELNIPWQLVDRDNGAVKPVGWVDSHGEAPFQEKTVSAAAYTVEKELPSLYAQVSPKQAASLLGKVSRDRDASILQAPRVTIFNGQRAQIADTIGRPYVVGMKNVATSPEPRIRVVEEGWRVSLRAIERNDSVWLECETKFSSLRNVENRDLPIKVNGKAVTLQIPEVALAQIAVTTNVHDSHSLVLYGLESRENDEETLIVMITPKVIEKGEKDEVAAEPKASTTERYRRHSLMGNIVVEEKAALVIPSDDQVIGLLKKQLEIDPDDDLKNVRIIKERIAAYVDPPRFYPLVGPAQLHHTHYKCTVRHEDANRNDATDVIYIDFTHILQTAEKPDGRLWRNGAEVESANDGDHSPTMLGPAPLGFDFSFPVVDDDHEGDERIFSFYHGVSR